MIGIDTITPTEFFRQYCPFRLFIHSLKEHEKLGGGKRHNLHTTESWKWQHLWNKKEKKNIWVCYLYVDRDRLLYFYYKGKTRPTKDEAINDFMMILRDYGTKEDLAELLKWHKSELDTDLNTLNIDFEEYLRHKANDLVPLLANVFTDKISSSMGERIIDAYFEEVQF